MILHPETDADNWFIDALAHWLLKALVEALRRGFTLPYRITLTNADDTVLCDLTYDMETHQLMLAKLVNGLYTLLVEMAWQWDTILTAFKRELQTPVMLEVTDCDGRFVEFTIEEPIPVPREQLQ